MEINAWTQSLRRLYDKATQLYRQGSRDLSLYFTEAEQATLASLGLKPINVYDFVEDFAECGEPDWDTFLLIVAARRDYFLYHQHGRPSSKEIRQEQLPPRDAELGGIRWLPRIIAKARCFLDGGLCHEIMYCCGGDRNFLKTHNLHPADFLRAVWSAHGDDEKILAFVRKAASA